MKKFFILLLPAILLLIPQDSQSQSRRVERADNAYELRQYSDALKYYQRAYNRVRRKDRQEATRILFQQAMCFRYLNEPRRAETFFRRAIRGRYPDPVAYFYFGEALMQNEKYDDALEAFTTYKEKVPDDWRGQWGIDAIEATEYLLENPGLYEVNLKRDFNSRQNDFAPAFGDNRNSILIFTSSREGAIGSKTDPWTGENFTYYLYPTWTGGETGADLYCWMKGLLIPNLMKVPLR